MSIVIIGPRCSGKTSVGKSVADTLKWGFLDGDEEIVKRFRPEYKDIAAFVKANGWRAFREAEAENISMLCRAFAKQDVVFTPGGGAAAHDQGEEYRQRNVDALRDFGNIYYLIPDHTDLEHSALVLAQRAALDNTTAGQRPSLTGTDDAVQDMLVTVKKRHELYRKAAHNMIPTEGKTIDEVAREIIRYNH